MKESIVCIYFSILQNESSQNLINFFIRQNTFLNFTKIRNKKSIEFSRTGKLVDPPKCLPSLKLLKKSLRKIIKIPFAVRS